VNLNARVRGDAAQDAERSWYGFETDDPRGWPEVTHQGGELPPRGADVQHGHYVPERYADVLKAWDHAMAQRWQQPWPPSEMQDLACPHAERASLRPQG
jgi:hypothetical protein